MFTIWKQLNFLSLIIYGLAFIEYCLSSADLTNSVRNCISETQSCRSNDGRVICYLVCSNISQSWDVAQRICAQHHSTLPVIRNRKEQESLESYLSNQKSRTRISGAAWTSGIKVTHDGWTWLNGQPFEGRVLLEDQSTPTDYKTHATLIKNGSFKQDNPLHPAWYMCQYRGNACATKKSLKLKNNCVVLSAKDALWYSARNVCLDGGGDLAVLSDQDLRILEGHPTAFIDKNTRGIKHYWIGLGTISWQWKFLNKTEHEDVKYSKWNRGAIPPDANRCISIQTSNGEWRASNCEDSYSVICQSEGNTSTSANPVSLTSTLVPTVPSSTSTSTRPTSTLGPGASSNSTNNPAESTDSTKISNPTDANLASGSYGPYGVYAIISVGVLLVFICIIFIFLLIRRRQKGAKEIRSSNANPIQLNNGSVPEEEPTKKMPKTMTASEDEVRGVYAEISPPKTSNKDPENDPSNLLPSGTVYASLEFKKDTTYAESIIKSKPSNAQTQKLGPVGDIYAIPTPKVYVEVGALKAENLNIGKIYENFGKST